ncbi:hypothetical protein PLANPX_1185 [Lacipirellula parvula]|uniref:Uncharacterized protein n=1 Tax=Lacipirellula parvula TaxID=2650471 RepID=A0A5K7XB90_9BACT|nr:hypothetical protein PLANPX_1185 [Lacipirellula parvula]
MPKGQPRHGRRLREVEAMLPSEEMQHLKQLVADAVQNRH